MILGFAHITKNVFDQRPGSALPNAPEKWPLMRNPASTYWLRLPRSDNAPQEEIISYDSDLVAQESRLGLFGTAIAMRVHDLDTEYRFFIPGLGFVAELGKLYLSSAVEHWRVRVLTWVDPDPFTPIDPPLDIEGYAALAFYSSDVEADRDHLLKHGGRTPTEPFTVELDRKMKIVMLRSPEGTIIELIQVVK
jgi:hypothetical protein